MWIACLFLFLVGCLLLYPELAFQCARNGLILWFERMVPTLLPFMILSTTIIRLGVSEKIGGLLHPVFSFIYKTSRNVSFGLAFGLLCGFPMGARIAAQLYEKNSITKKEAEFLLYISNSIGPVYFCGFALPLLGLHKAGKILTGMYGIPLLYGFILRMTAYRNIKWENNSQAKDTSHSISATKFLRELNESISISVENILSMGGYMILFNLLFMVPKLFFENYAQYLYPLIEITGGIVLCGSSYPIYALVMLSFGGICCICQTYNCIQKTDLSIFKYVLHKSIIAILVLFYLQIVMSF